MSTPIEQQKFAGRNSWALLINGDSETMDRIEADAVIADPPYGISYCHGARKGGVKLGTDGEAIIGDDKPFDPRPWLGYPVVVLWGANHYASRLPDSPAWLVWDKRDGVCSNDQADCELAWTNLRSPARLKRHLWIGMLKDSEYDEQRVHPMQKPVVLMAWAMEKCRVPIGATVLDPYMGSGTIGIACLRTGRNFIGIEIDTRYYKLACDRIARELDGALL